MVIFLSSIFILLISQISFLIHWMIILSIKWQKIVERWSSDGLILNLQWLSFSPCGNDVQMYTMTSLLGVVTGATEHSSVMSGIVRLVLLFKHLQSWMTKTVVTGAQNDSVCGSSEIHVAIYNIFVSFFHKLQQCLWFSAEVTEVKDVHANHNYSYVIISNKNYIQKI